MTDRQIKNAASCQKLARILFAQGDYEAASSMYRMAMKWMGI